MSQERIKEIIEDLFLIDPELRKYENKIRDIITAMIKEKPDAKFDKRFVNRLKEKLLAKEYETPKTVPSFWMKVRQPAIVWASTATVLAFILLVTVSTNFIGKDGSNGYLPDESPVARTVALFGRGVNIEEAPANSFGSITAQSFNNASGGDGIRQESGVALGMGGGGGTAASPMIATDSSAKIDSRMSMIYPYIYYTYTYEGEAITDLQGEVEVYERQKSGTFKPVVAQKLKDFDFGFFDINKLSNIEVNSLEVSENRDFGYSVSISLADESASIYQNWQKWNNDVNASYSPLTESDVPSEDTIINLAKQFVAQYGIDTTPFGEPELGQYAYRVMYKTDAEATSYIPDTMNVVFPLMLDGQAVYEQSGQKVGLMVDVNIRQNKVSGAYQIYNQDYQKSSYAAQTDWNKIIEAVNNGGYPGQRYVPEYEYETIELKLDTPFRGLVRTWTYEAGTGTSRELYAEALLFPIKNKPAGYYNDYVVVPLVQQWWDGVEGDGNRILPMGGAETPAIDVVEPAPAIDQPTSNGAAEPAIMVR